MVEIIDPTINAMMLAISREHDKEQPRDYLGASLIGDKCPRKVWYEYNGYEKEPFPANVLLKFDDGHRTEDLTAQRLRMVDGLQLWTHDENGNQYGFSVFNGKFRGHCDGIIKGLLQAPKTVHVWECKACEPKKYNEFIRCKEKFGEKEALRHWNEQYYVQAQILMHYMQLTRHYTTVASAGGRAYQTCRTEYDPITAEIYIERAEKIINATEPPSQISQQPDYFICKMCNFRKICHG